MSRFHNLSNSRTFVLTRVFFQFHFCFYSFTQLFVHWTHGVEPGGAIKHTVSQTSKITSIFIGLHSLLWYDLQTKVYNDVE